MSLLVPAVVPGPPTEDPTIRDARPDIRARERAGNSYPLEPANAYYRQSLLFPRRILETNSFAKKKKIARYLLINTLRLEREHRLIAAAFRNDRSRFNIN